MDGLHSLQAAQIPPQRDIPNVAAIACVNTTPARRRRGYEPKACYCAESIVARCATAVLRPRVLSAAIAARWESRGRALPASQL